MGKTAGRGHKGQRARSGGYKKVGFEGGQMPLQRRLPKRGFQAPKKYVAEVRLESVSKLEGEVDLAALKHAGLIARSTRSAKVIGSGQISEAVTLKGVRASRGARAAIEAAGGQVSE